MFCRLIYHWFKDLDLKTLPSPVNFWFSFHFVSSNFRYFTLWVCCGSHFLSGSAASALFLNQNSLNKHFTTYDEGIGSLYIIYCSKYWEYHSTFLNISFWVLVNLHNKECYTMQQVQLFQYRKSVRQRQKQEYCLCTSYQWCH